jgi:hypothetical protein
MRRVSHAPLRREGNTMHTETLRDVPFEAQKDVTRLAWLLNFEALACVPPAADAGEDA